MDPVTKAMIIKVALGFAATVGAYVVWAGAKYALERFREYAETTPTKADDELADDLEDVVDSLRPGKDDD